MPTARSPRPYLLVLLAMGVLAAVPACSDSAEKEAATTTSMASTTTAPQTTTTIAGIEPKAWAKGFCKDYRRWLAAMQLAAGFVDGDVTQGDVASGQAAIVNLFEVSSTETETLIGQIEEGDVPKVKNGDRLVEDLITRFGDFNTVLEAAKTEAEKLPADDPEAFKSEVAELTKSFQAEINAVSTDFDELDATYPSPALQAALAESCAPP